MTDGRMEGGGLEDKEGESDSRGKRRGGLSQIFALGLLLRAHSISSRLRVLLVQRRAAQAVAWRGGQS